MKITFERIVRDCPANDQQIDARKMIFDFDVMIDGERRAVWHREYRGRGYELRDLNQEAIFPDAEATGSYRASRSVKADKKDDFFGIIETLLAAGRIPTAAESLAREIGWGRAILEAREIEDAKMRAGCIKQRAADLYHLAVMAADGAARDAQFAAVDIIAQIDQATKDFIALTRKHQPMNKWEAEAVAKFEAALAIGEA